MIRVRWWFMYLLSSAIGYTVGAALLLAGNRYDQSIRAVVRPTAIRHADRFSVGAGPVPDEECGS